MRYVFILLATTYFVVGVYLFYEMVSSHDFEWGQLLIVEIFALVLLSLFLRYLRWLFFLKRLGFGRLSLTTFAVYLSGLAFTSTPGKVGEIARYRYTSNLTASGTATARQLGYADGTALFVMERFQDVMIFVTFSTMLLFSNARELMMALAIILVCLIFFWRLFQKFLHFVVTVVESFSKWIAKNLGKAKELSLDEKLQIIYSVDVTHFVSSFIIGIFAWLPIVIVPMLLISSVSGSSIISCEVIIGYLGIYPLAALGGAASLVPGGIGVTEVGMSALIQKVSPSVGILDAITVAFIFRVYSFWLVGLISFFCVFRLEKSLNNRGN